jgi:circadian clock protein KaiC
VLALLGLDAESDVASEELTAMMLQKTHTGISGFDEVTGGGLPAGRASLFCGAAGSGKTLFGLTFLVNGVRKFNEPGVLVSFEERCEDLAANCASLGYDLNGLVAEGKIFVDHVQIERHEIEESGAYDLEALLLRISHAVESVGARRLVLDTVEALFSAFTNIAVLRAELRRLFCWIKDRNLTAIITGERGEGQLTRQGLEEYVSDCVVLLDNRAVDEITTRRLRIVKYRGSPHGMNEYPFLVDDEGISVLPVTSAGLNRVVSNDFVSTGIASLDAMLGNGGFYRGSSVLLSGVAGTGKTTAACHFIDAACKRGDRCAFFIFEESASEVCRNIRSVGIDLQQWVDRGLLLFEDARPSVYGLEMRLARMHRDLDQFKPAIVAIDPISALRGPPSEVHAALVRMVDLLKSRGITSLFTILRSGGSLLNGSDAGLSSLMDSWVRLLGVEENGERNRILCIIKSRGSHHSNQVREYRITDNGITLLDPYVGADGYLTGTALVARDARERAAEEVARQEAFRGQRKAELRHQSLKRQLDELQSLIDREEEEGQSEASNSLAAEARLENDRKSIAASRGIAE